MIRERRPWDDLYRRALRGDTRPPAEVDSVPLPESWGELPDSEWEADAFLIPLLQGSSTWLDLGCGTGSVLAAFLRRFPQARGVGVDASMVAIALGQSHVAADLDLSRRATLLSGDLRRPPVSALAPFDLVYALFSLQFLRPLELYELAAALAHDVLAPAGVFAGTVRSTSRSVPQSYVPVDGEPNTYLSGEPHEVGMMYHHYACDELHEAARRMGGRVVYLHEKRSRRDYDPAPERAWWDFVITRQPSS